MAVLRHAPLARLSMRVSVGPRG